MVRKKYGAWTPHELRSGGSGTATGMASSSVIRTRYRSVSRAPAPSPLHPDRSMPAAERRVKLPRNLLCFRAANVSYSGGITNLNQTHGGGRARPPSVFLDNTGRKVEVRKCRGKRARRADDRSPR